MSDDKFVLYTSIIESFPESHSVDGRDILMAGQDFNLLLHRLREYEKKNIDLTVEMCANMLQTSCFQLHSDLAHLKDRIERVCRRNVCLSGSGSSMFVLFNACDAKIQTCRRDLERNLGILCRVVNINRW